MEGGFLLDVVIAQRPSIFQLFTGEDETLLIWGDSFFILDLGFHIVDRVAWFYLKGDGLTGKGFHKNLHFGGFFGSTP